MLADVARSLQTAAGLRLTRARDSAKFLAAKAYGLKGQHTSSGISQLVQHSGSVSAALSFDCPGGIIAGPLQLDRAGRLPWDRFLAPLSAAFTALLAFWLLAKQIVGSSGVTGLATPRR
ncbi:MAG: hypothetical protein U1G07_13505 [Verrucomicrobiota bacterium]